MINDFRVGIPIVGGKGWLGGVSHMELHVKAVTTLPRHERPQLFLVITDDSLDSFSLYRPFSHLFDGILFMGSGIEAASTVVGMPLLHCSSWTELFTAIDFLFPVSFNVLPGRCAASWIHDFQHKHLPEFFPAQDIIIRDELCRRIADQSRLVFCSSKAVEKDFWRFYPHSQAITKVLALRVAPEDEWYAGNPNSIQLKYDLPDRFLLCSNQFWVHKNHRLLLEAISILRQTGHDIHLVCTGLTSDFRCPGYFEELNQYIEHLGISDLVHILGQIPRQDQIQLIRRCLVVVQPSLFEGLSLIVQECRALGKAIILSDLEVHLEHEYGIYFKRTDAQDLADKIFQLLPVTQPGPDAARETEARLQAVGLITAYAKEFCSMVVEAQKLFGNKPAIPTGATLIGTSIVPEADMTRQRQAVSSWLGAGFEVVSLNRPEDIGTLQPEFPSVKFVAVARKSEEQYGANSVALSDLFSYFTQTDFTVCGIVEPDICLYGDNLASRIAKEAANCFVYQAKDSVEAVQTYEGTAFPGFGCIFFDRRLINNYPAEDFSLGQPWWDYWAILISIIRKIPVKRITTPFAYHITHAEHYDVSAMLALCETLTQYAPPPFAMSAQTVAKYQHILAQIINNHSLDIALYDLFFTSSAENKEMTTV